MFKMQLCTEKPLGECIIKYVCMYTVRRNLLLVTLGAYSGQEGAIYCNHCFIKLQLY